MKRLPFVFFVALVSFVSSVLIAEHGTRLEYSDLPRALQQRLSSEGVDEGRFRTYLEGVDAETARRVADGEREHLIYYALQSNAFTAHPRIEPAVSSRRFVDRLAPAEREHLIADPSYLPSVGWPAAERARVSDLLRALGKPTTDRRLGYFNELLTHGAARGGHDRRPEDGPPRSGPHVRLDDADALYPDYVRVARFLYRKEFLSAGTAPADVAQVARLYQTRAHSSDTHSEAGFGVYLGLGALRALGSAPRINRVVIVGPGLDLAPRTDLIDVVAPQSYQPFAVADALLALSLSSERDLHIHSVDVNPRVVQFMQAVARGGLTLHLFGAITETPERPFSDDYRAYQRELGRAIGDAVAPPREAASEPRYQRSILVRSSIRQTMTAEQLNIVTERAVDSGGADLVVATNVLSYFDDRQLALALANIAGLLRPGGYLLHNESRQGLAELSTSLDLPVLHMRTAVIAGPAARPLYDTVWLHQKAMAR